MALETPQPTVGPPQTVPTGAQTAVIPAHASRIERLRATGIALLHSKTFVIGMVILLFWVLDAILWPLFVPHDPQALNPIAELQGPSASHWFGTDDSGRDMFSRVLAGASDVLKVAPAATALGLLGGIILGLVTGYYRGLVDDVLMRFVDALLAFPLVIIAILVLAALGTGVWNVIIIIAVVFMPIVARTVRAAVLTEREREYVASAKLLGESDLHIMFTEILPNITGPIAVEATIRLGYAIFTSATLSFLGLGIQQPSPDWGLTISLGKPLLQVAPWIVLFPAFALATLIIGLNFVADGLKQVLEE